jgi:hypothetical protein
MVLGILVSERGAGGKTERKRADMKQDIRIIKFTSMGAHRSMSKVQTGLEFMA